MARGNPSALKAFNEFARPYRAGLKFGTHEFWEATRRAGHDYREGKGREHHESNPDLIPKFHGGHKVLLGIAAVAGGLWLFKRWQASNAERKAADTVAQRRALDQLSDNTLQSRAIESKAIAGIQSHTLTANVGGQTYGKPGF